MEPKPTTEKRPRIEPAALAAACSVLKGPRDAKMVTHLCHQFTSAKAIRTYAMGHGDRDWQALEKEAQSVSLWGWEGEKATSMTQSPPPWFRVWSRLPPTDRPQFFIGVVSDFLADILDDTNLFRDLVCSSFKDRGGVREAIKLLQASSNTAGSQHHETSNPETPQNPSSKTVAPAGNLGDSSEPETPNSQRPPQNPDNAASDSPSRFETPEDDFGGSCSPPRRIASGKRTHSQMIEGHNTPASRSPRQSTIRPEGDSRGDLEANASKRVDSVLGKVPIASRSYGILMRVRYCGLLLPEPPPHAQAYQSQYTLLVRGHQQRRRPRSFCDCGPRRS